MNVRVFSNLDFVAPASTALGLVTAYICLLQSPGSGQSLLCCGLNVELPVLLATLSTLLGGIVTAAMAGATQAMPRAHKALLTILATIPMLALAAVLLLK